MRSFVLDVLDAAHATVTEFIFTGFLGQSSFVGTFEILTITAKLAWSTHLPKTGCFESPGENLRATKGGHDRGAMIGGMAADR